MSMALFLLHQGAQKILGWSWPWADSYLDDLLCMPILLGLALAERRFFLGQAKFTFPLFDTAIMVIALSLLFEEVYPRMWNDFVRDDWDYAYYLLGGGIFYFFLQKDLSLSKLG